MAWSLKNAEGVENGNWSDSEHQIYAPAMETAEQAFERRSEGLKPALANAEASKWAQPSDRKEVPTHVPLSRQELRETLSKRYLETIQKYAQNVGADLPGHPDYQPLIEEMRAIPPGALKKDKAKVEALMARWMKISADIEAQTGTSQADLRELYNVVEKDDFKAWFGHVTHLPLEQQAKLGHMWRQELRIMIRDMMGDKNSKEVLYLRDRAMSGDRRGPLFEDFLKRTLKDPKAAVAAAVGGTMASGQRPKEGVNKGVTGSKDGVSDAASEIRASRVENLDDKRRRLTELSAEARTGTPEQKANAQAELATLGTKPEWQDAIAKHKVLDNLFATLMQNQDKEKAPDLELLSGHIGNMLAGQDQAREGADVVLQAKRERFERALALSILKDGPVRQAIDHELGQLCAKALDYIQKTRTTAEAQEKALAGMHTEQAKGYGGGLKVEGSTDAENAKLMMEVLQSGNIRERMLALSQFMDMIGKDALSPEGRAKLDEMTGKEGSSKTEFSATEAKALVERVLQLESDLSEGAAKKRDVKTLFNPNSTESGEGEAHGAYQNAKNQNMDTKLPPLLADKVNEFIGKELVKSGTVVDGAEKSPLVRTTITVAEAIKKGLELSDREIAAAGGLDGKLDWVIGLRANMVDANAEFIKTAKERSMPIKAGISGTTFRWMRLVDMLGGNKELARLAAVASLQAANAHSYHEIAFAAQGFGVTYDANKPYANMGISEAHLNEIAASVGTNLEELNKHSEPKKAKEPKAKGPTPPKAG